MSPRLPPLVTLLALLGPSARSADLMVTTVADVVNGDTASPDALGRNPGTDGISLREAIQACNNSVGPHSITFAPALAGHAIVLAADQPLLLMQDGTSVTGLTDSSGVPTVTLDCHNLTRLVSAVYILASNVTVNSLLFIGQVRDALEVYAGTASFAPHGSRLRQSLSNVRIANNIFTPPNTDSTQGAGVRVLMDPEALSVGASIDSVTITGNKFMVYRYGNGVELSANGTGCVIRNVVIEDNLFNKVINAVTVETTSGSGNQVLGTQILRNTFVGDYPQPTVFIGHLQEPYANSGAVIDGTVFAGNNFSGSALLQLLGGDLAPAATGPGGVSNCTISNTRFVNNVFMPGTIISLQSGTEVAPNNRITGVQFINDTISADLVKIGNNGQSFGNNVTGVSFLNTIIGSSVQLRGLSSDMVSYSLVAQEGFAGARGNVAGDPKFVDAASGDYRLRAGSPAIDAGTSEGAPATDRDGRARFDDPATANTGTGTTKYFDLGAHEFNPALFAAAPAAGRSAVAGSSATMSVTAVGTGPFTYQWRHDGAVTPAGTNATLTLNNLQSVDTGLYVATVTNATTSATSTPTIVGLNSASKVIGNGTEIAPNILHPNGNTFDQILLEGVAASITADAGQITRLSYIDLTNDIVQVEFAGAGTLSVVLDALSGPAVPLNYNQPTTYVKGHAGIVVTGANETTNLSVFSVGRGNAVNQALFRSDVTYDGLAGIAFVAIQSVNGKFGGLRTANAHYFATKGIAGVFAPGVQFTGPVFVGDINASDNATPMFVIGSGTITQINGGDLLQPNGRAVEVAGLTQLKFVAGSTSHHTDADPHLLPAQVNKARLEQNGVNVTAQVVVNP